MTVLPTPESAESAASLSGTGGPFSGERLAEALTGVCAAAGLDPEGATLIKCTANAVFRLASAPVVVRIGASTALNHRVEKVVHVATWLAEHDVPAVRLLPGVAQPVTYDGYVATIWEAVPTGGERPRGRDLGKLLRRIHDLPEPASWLPTWRPLADVAARIGEATDLDDTDLAFLQDRYDDVADQLSRLEFPSAPSLVHGDAHLGNLIPGPAGPVWCDFDSSSLGPPEWDLTPLAVGVIRFGEPAGRYRELVRTYGVDVTRWRGFPVLRAVRELKLITSVLPIIGTRPAVRAELFRRMADVRSGNTSARWARYT
ncbi:phosphotransferase family protein [Actinophytocola glycyrrhizae]|uniref:Phosphotransferase family protein n=1 Tax=Actinophytocola glycyrrhizae TaxID=2044873 RepID=A0ABV9S204_9PSEU